MNQSPNNNNGLTSIIKELEDKLQATEQHLADLSQTSTDWFWETDAEMRFTQISHRYFEITGVPPSEAMGKTRFELVPEKEQQRRREDWQKHQEDINARRPFRNFEYGIQGIHGATRYVRINGKPVFKPDGTFKGYMGTGTDETDRMEAQLALEQTQIELLQSEKLASIGQLAAGAAHEINTPIGFITLNLQTLGEYATDLIRLIEKQHQLLEAHNLSSNTELQMLEEEIDLDYLKQDLPELLRQSNEGINKISHIIYGLQEYASPIVNQNSTPSNIDINRLIKEASESVALSCKLKNIKLDLNLGQLPIIQGIESQLCQLFSSLLQNAEQSITEQGSINISSRSSEDGDSVLIEIRDTGCGIDAATLNKIYDPFFTTKAVGSGTGLGLSMAQGIIQSHNGSITVESEPDKGTVFNLQLPITSN